MTTKQLECPYCHRGWLVELEDDGSIHEANKICDACGKGILKEPEPLLWL